MDIIKLLITIVLGYLLGSLSSSVLLSINAWGGDVRKKGSGNAGATNMARVFGWTAGLLTLAGDAAKAILAMLAGLLAPLFRPLGLGDWRICTSFITGFLAKESVVSTLGILFSGSVASALTPLAAGCLLVFCLLYTPCVASVAAIRRELGGKWAAAVVLWQCILAWLAALLLRLIGLLLGVA
jgi:Fe2+ transport system protein B